MTTPLFLTADELHQLTGKRLKALQIAHLRSSGIPFRVNACGKPVVTRAAIEGIVKQPDNPTWKPAVLQGGRQGR